MRCPTHHHEPKSRMPEERSLIKPAPCDNHKSKEAIHDHETSQTYYEKRDRVDESSDQRQSFIASSVVHTQIAVKARS